MTDAGDICRASAETDCHVPQCLTSLLVLRRYSQDAIARYLLGNINLYLTLYYG